MSLRTSLTPDTEPAISAALLLGFALRNAAQMHVTPAGLHADIRGMHVLGGEELALDLGGDGGVVEILAGCFHGRAMRRTRRRARPSMRLRARFSSVTSLRKILGANLGVVLG